MNREEAKKRLEVWLMCVHCPEEKKCYDSYLHATCEYTDFCDDVPIEEAIKVAIKALEQKPCDKCVYSTSEGCQYDDITETIPPFEISDDAISRQAVLKIIDGWYEQNRDTDNIEDLIVLITYMDSVNPQKPICPSAGVDCEDCPAYEKKSEWEHDHEILKAYSDGANEVLDKIRAEIDAARFLDKDKKLFKNANASGLEVAMDIIDKYKSGSEEV